MFIRFLPLFLFQFLFALGGDLKTMTPLDVAKLRTVIQAEISPDGTSIAYVVSVPRTLFEHKNGSAWREIHVWNAERGSRPYVSGKIRVSGVKWTPDGKGISFLSKRNGDKRVSLYVIPIDGGEAKRVLTHITAIGEYTWSPEGKRLIFLASEPKDGRRKRLEEQGFDQEIFEEDWEPNRVWLADLSGDVLQTTSWDFEGSAVAVSWSPAGDRVALTLAPTSLVDDTLMNSKVRVVDALSGEVVARVDTPGKLDGAVWSPDGKYLAVIGAADRNDPSPGRLYVVSVDGGSQQKFFMEDEGEVRALTWADNETLFYLWDVGVSTELRSLIPVQKKVQTLLAGNGPLFSTLSFHAPSRTLAMVGESVHHPRELFQWRLGADRAERLTHVNPWLDHVGLGRQEVVEYRARDGLELQGLLIRPVGEIAGQRYPLILTVHGGPESHFRNGWLTRYSYPGQVAAGRGYAVFYPNYRASTGRGVAFSKLNHGRPAMEEFDDLVDGVRYLVDELKLVDEKKVGVTGGSYGGYATAWCATKLSRHFAAGVMFVGISNKISKQGTSDIPDEVVLVHDRKELWDDWQHFLEQSPIYHVQNARTPLLILHGMDDPRVPQSQSMELYRHLERLDQVPVRLVRYPGEKHGNRKAASRYDLNLRILRWFEHYLKGEGGEMPPGEIDYPKHDAAQEKPAWNAQTSRP